ncbi:MAG: hypothetical protein COX70_02680 [Flavobacteriales bacterium CG_4_10_14_0_2_um_filter_32_8]|nr:MAG: hypothetical protein COX70_02680 [Flavobacteriales bacterium CG_4_10_14_0_2_um_filter_32_8]PJB15833.1 MAG: hypothetical protein CO118_01985 [Flavobacteriales bacterium CG_4_9_14_3_um_filter_32_8]
MKFIQTLLVTLILFIAIPHQSIAQSLVVDSLHTSDTIKVNPIKIHSPTKATLFSTAFPGLGQVYNHKYWKVPIIYAGMGISIYFVVTNKKSFNNFKTAYGYRIDGNPLTIDEYEGRLSESSLKSYMDYYQRNKDLSYIVSGLFYILNIVDAAVDAHLFDFPKNDNLSFNFMPSIELTDNNQVASGFKLVINL